MKLSWVDLPKRGGGGSEAPVAPLSALPGSALDAEVVGHSCTALPSSASSLRSHLNLALHLKQHF